MGFIAKGCDVQSKFFRISQENNYWLSFGFSSLHFSGDLKMATRNFSIHEVREIVLNGSKDEVFDDKSDSDISDIASESESGREA